MNELISALTRFHVAVGRVLKTSRADRYSYADLATVIETVRGPLAEQGLAVVQTFAGRELVTTLWHTSGHSIESRLELPPIESRGMNAAQAMGSAISYSRRYALLAILGLAAEDDDGQGTAPPARGHASRVGGTPPATLSPTEEIRQLQQRLGLPASAVVQALEGMGYHRVAELSSDELESLKTQLLDLKEATP